MTLGMCASPHAADRSDKVDVSHLADRMVRLQHPQEAVALIPEAGLGAFQPAGFPSHER